MLKKSLRLTDYKFGSLVPYVPLDVEPGSDSYVRMLRLSTYDKGRM